MVVPIAVATSVNVLISGASSGPLLPSGKRRFTYNEVSSITKNFNKVIGKGGFGVVYLGSLEDGTKIAVKMINDSYVGKPKGSSSSSRVSNQFQVKAELLWTVHHWNLGSFVGYCDDDRSIALIYEYMANDNLQAYLSSENAEDLSWEKRLHIAIDSAYAASSTHTFLLLLRPPFEFNTSPRLVAIKTKSDGENEDLHVSSSVAVITAANA